MTRGAAALLAVLAFAAPALAAPSGQALVYDRVTSDELARILADMGIPAEQAIDPTGDPQLQFVLEGYNVLLVTYGCEAGACNSVQLYAGFDMGKKKVKLATINDWNRDRRYGRAYLDAEGHAVIEYDLDLEGGIPQQALVVWIETFRSLVITFAAHIGFQ